MAGLANLPAGVTTDRHFKRPELPEPRLNEKEVYYSDLTRSRNHEFGSCEDGPETRPDNSEKTVVHDPFIVQRGDSEGYQANCTLAGQRRSVSGRAGFCMSSYTLAATRLKTNFKDIVSSISVTVVTRQFLDDAGVQVTLRGNLGLDEPS
jgi:hypothetical protein